MVLPQWFDRTDTAVKVAVIAACASVLTTLLTVFHSLFGAPLKYWLEKKALRNKLETEYEYDQRKSLRDLIARYRGQMVEDAETLNHRMWNLYENEGKGWLKMDGRYDQYSYYFRSWVYRFLNLLAIVRRFEREATFIDSRIAEKSDLDFIKYGKAFMWATSDVALFDGIDYSGDRQKDHLFRDTVRLVCDACCRDGDFLDQETVHQVLQDHKYQSVYRFFDDLSKNEDRLRWDRLVVIDLLIMGFLNTFGYDTQRSSEKDFDRVVTEARNDQVLQNLNTWLYKLGLGKQPGAIFIRSAVENRLTKTQPDSQR